MAWAVAGSLWPAHQGGSEDRMYWPAAWLPHHGRGSLRRAALGEKPRGWLRVGWRGDDGADRRRPLPLRCPVPPCSSQPSPIIPAPPHPQPTPWLLPECGAAQGASAMVRQPSGRKEVARLNSLRGQMKFIGTIVSLAGATVMALYKGPTLKLNSALIHFNVSNKEHENWVAGSISAVASCICWSAWFVMQVYSIERYPAPLSLTSWMCLIGGIQSAIITLIAEKKNVWVIGLGINFWCIVYSGIACNGFTFVAQLWCMQKKGCVFVTMFDPLAAIMVSMLAFFIFGENIHMGSVIGTIIVILGVYMLLWAKAKDDNEDERTITRTITRMAAEGQDIP